MTIINPNPEMLVRIAQGDAYGMSCEYDNRNLKEALLFDRYIRHPKWGPDAGMYTDDTQMSIANSICLINNTTMSHTREEYADSYVTCFKRDERPAYAPHFQKLLESIGSGDELLDKISPKSVKNGAAMRSVPFGVLKNVFDVKKQTSLQAGVTHATIAGRLSSSAVGLMSWYALHTNEPLSNLQEFLEDEHELPFDPWPGGPVKGKHIGMITARAVMTLLMEQRTLLGIAAKCLLWGGDTDSVLAIAWGIASARMKEPLPPFFDEQLENGKYGKDYLLELGTTLMNRYV